MHTYAVRIITPEGYVPSAITLMGENEPHRGDVVVQSGIDTDTEYVIAQRRWEGAQLVLLLDPVLR